MERQNASHEIKATVATARDFVDYQTSSIVSKTVINKQHGTVTFFAFDKGQRLSEHIVPFDALVFVLDGEAEITISGSASRLGAGQMILMPANEPHAVKAVEQFKMVLVMVKS